MLRGLKTLRSCPTTRCRASYRRLSAAINQSGRSLRISRSPPEITRRPNESVGHKSEPPDSSFVRNSRRYPITGKGMVLLSTSRPCRHPPAACTTKPPHAIAWSGFPVIPSSAESGRTRARAGRRGRPGRGFPRGRFRRCSRARRPSTGRSRGSARAARVRRLR